MTIEALGRSDHRSLGQGEEAGRTALLGPFSQRVVPTPFSETVCRQERHCPGPLSGTCRYRLLFGDARRDALGERALQGGPGGRRVPSFSSGPPAPHISSSLVPSKG